MTSLVGSNPTGLVLIQEASVVSSGLPILHHFLSKLSSKKQIYFLAVEQSVEFHLSKLRASSIHFVDCFTNPLGWNTTSNNSSNPNITLSNYSTLQNILIELKVPDKGNTIIAIDSLSPLLLHHGVSQVCRFLHQLKAQYSSSVFCLLHRELHDETTYKQLEYIATFNLVLDTSPKGLNNNIPFPSSTHQQHQPQQPQTQPSSSLSLSPSPSPSHSFTIYVLHKRASGKVSDVVENYSLNGQGAVTFITTSQRQGAKGGGGNDTPAATTGKEDPAANLTFNLNLTPQERNAREEVQLPYIHQEKSAPTVDEEEGEYEEDPDDDLDI